MDSNSNIDDVNSLKTLKQVRKRGFAGGDHWCNFTEMNIELLSMNSQSSLFISNAKKHLDSKETHFKVTKKTSKQNKPHKGLCHLKQLVNAPPQPPPPKNKTPPWSQTWRCFPHPTKLAFPRVLRIWKFQHEGWEQLLHRLPWLGFCGWNVSHGCCFEGWKFGGWFSSEKHMLQYEKLTLINNPGDSKWPFYPLVGGHLTFERVT